MSSLLVGRGGAVLATASAMMSEVGVLGVCVVCVVVVRRVQALAVSSSDYRSDDDQVGALVVMCMDWRVRRERGRWLLWVLVGGGRGKGEEEAVYLRCRWKSRGVVR
jgi:hypothetical protein